MKSQAFALAIIGVSLNAAAADATLRAECRKPDDRGCTARATNCVSAPDGKYIDNVTPGSVVDFWNKNAQCGAPRMASHVPFQIPNTDINAFLFTSFCADLHVESGSGPADIGKVAYVNCRYTYGLRDIPKNR